MTALLGLLVLGLAAAAARAAPALNPPPARVQDLLELPTNAASWVLCSGLFVAGLPLEVVVEEDCDINCLLSNVTVDYAERSVTVALKGTGAYPFKAIWRGDGIGCTVVDGITEAELRAQDIGDQSPLPRLNTSVPWPLGDFVERGNLPDDVDWDAVNAAVDADFAEESYNTRAVIMVHRGRIVLERYAPGITDQTRLLGWSCTKTLTNALVGILVGEGRLNLSAPAPVPEWQQDPDDPRRRITLNNMMQMAGGILWREAPGDVRCLHTVGDGDCAGFYAQSPVEDPPGARFEYSTGNSMLLMRTVMQQRGDPQWNNFEYLRQKLFRPLSMVSALIEPQANGYPAGGSLAYMKAQDWARIGLLFLRDGVWVDGSRIFPEGWVTYTSTPAPTSSYYGAQTWIHIDLPTRGYYMSGFREQNVSMFPDKDLVVARFSMPKLTGGGFSKQKFLTDIVNAFPDVPA